MAVHRVAHGDKHHKWSDCHGGGTVVCTVLFWNLWPCAYSTIYVIRLLLAAMSVLKQL